jgi:hypothetical protein
LGLPSIWVGATPPATPVSGESDAFVMCFCAPQQQFALELTLAANTIGPAQTAPST